MGWPLDRPIAVAMTLEDPIHYCLPSPIIAAELSGRRCRRRLYLARQMGAFERRSLEVTFADAASAAAMRERR
jgi:hypothetical protein